MARQQKFSKWRRLANAVAANADDIPHLEGSGQRLATMLNDAEVAADQQLTFAASKQDASQRLLAFETDGAKLAAFLASGIREHYGNRSEKLTEFGLQPSRRGHSRAVEPPAPEEAQADPVNDPQP